MIAGEATPPPEIPGWYYVACIVAVAVAVFNLWRFRTGWRIVGEHHKPELSEFVVRVGYAAVPFLVAVVGLTLSLVLFHFVAEYQTGALGLAFLLCVAVSLGAILVGLKETKRPSRWNKTPSWLREARARGEIGPN